MNLGVFIKHVGASQLAYCAIKNLNTLVKVHKNFKPVIFYEEVNRECLTPGFAYMYAEELWGFDGTVISTSLATAEKVNRSTGNKRKIFYFWDFDWLRGPINYTNMINILDAQDMYLARSEEHKEVIEKILGYQVAGVVDDFNLEDLVKVIS